MTLPLTWLGCGSLHRRKEDPLAEAAGGGLAWFTCGLQWTPELPWCPADIRCQLRASWEAGCCIRQTPGRAAATAARLPFIPLRGRCFHKALATPQH